MLNQALHGYNDGHRLLASSIDIPSTSHRLMLLLSDLSGSSHTRGFDTYLTGYPLPEMGAYALARTWYASEMKRPGCVWTHTLIIRFDELDRLDDLNVLSTLFARPELRDGYTRYSVPMDAQQAQPTYEKPQIIGVSNEIVLSLIDGLYSSHDTPVVVGDTTSERLEGLVLSLWAQQWPRLRRNFTFCTGAISPRYWQDNIFDLQVAPLDSLSEFVRVLPKNYIVNRTSNEYRVVPSWLEIALNDIYSSKGRGLRDFLWQFSTDVSSLRAAYKPLVSLYDMLLSTDGCQVDTLIKALAVRFPKSHQGANLKISILSQGLWFERVRECSGGIEIILEALASTPYFASLPIEELKLRELAAGWTRTNIDCAAELLTKLMRQPITAINEHVIGGILQAIGPDDVFRVVNTQPHLMPIFVSAYPMLATDARVWRTPVDFQHRIWNEVWKLQLYEWNKIIEAMLDASSMTLAGDVINKLGYHAVDAVLQWVMKRQKSLSQLPEPWSRALADNPTYLLQWLEGDVKDTMELLPEVLLLMEPNSNTVKEIPRQVLINLSAVCTGDYAKASEVSSAFLLAYSFGRVDAKCHVFACVSFEVVHNTARLNQMHYPAFRWLEPYLPHYIGYSDWDDCGKLREAFVERFIRNQWPLQSFLDAMTNPQTLYWTITTCSESRERRSFLSRVITAVRRGEVRTTAEQRELLLSKKKDRR